MNMNELFTDFLVVLMSAAPLVTGIWIIVENAT